MAASRTVLITGASGLLGSHVVEQALLAGYHVRATARSSKVDIVKATYASYGDQLEVVLIDDIISSDFTTALQSVTAVIHLATTIGGRGDNKTVLDSAIQGTKNVLEQAIKAGVKRLVIPSSLFALHNPKKGEKLHPELYNDQDWNDETVEEGMASTDLAVVYAVAKSSAERVAWNLIDQHPDVDLTVFNLPYLLGRFVKGWPVPAGESWAMTSNGFVYDFLNGVDAPFHRKRILHMDLSTAARAHVLALTAPPASEVGQKRLLLAADDYFTWAELAEHLREVRPAVGDRLAKYEDTARWGKEGPLAAAFDTKRTQEILGIETIPGWKQVLVEAVDDILRLEGEWEKQGWKRPDNYKNPY